MSREAIIAVRVTPRASQDAIEGADDAGELRVRVTAPPADGAANKAVLRSVAKALGLPQSAVTLVSGAAARHKRLSIEGVEAAILLQRWPGLNVTSR